jgi:DNA-binding transcriptional LysR family regulator
VAAHSGRIQEEAHQLEQVVGSINDEPRGTLRVSASVAFGTLHTAPTLTDFLTAYPRLKMELTITDRLIDLAEEGYDMAIRVTAEPPLPWWRESSHPCGANCAVRRRILKNIGLPLIPPIWCITTA